MKKTINEEKVNNKLRELLGHRVINFETEFSTLSIYTNVVVKFGLSDIVIPNNNPPYLNLITLNDIACEFEDNEIEFRLGNYQIIMDIIIRNNEYYIS